MAYPSRPADATRCRWPLAAGRWSPGPELLSAGSQCRPLRTADGVPLAVAAFRHAAVGHGLVVLPHPAAGRHAAGRRLGAKQCHAAGLLPGDDWARTDSQRGDPGPPSAKITEQRAVWWCPWEAGEGPQAASPGGYRGIPRDTEGCVIAARVGRADTPDEGGTLPLFAALAERLPPGGGLGRRRAHVALRRMGGRGPGWPGGSRWRRSSTLMPGCGTRGSGPVRTDRRCPSPHRSSESCRAGEWSSERFLAGPPPASEQGRYGRARDGGGRDLPRHGRAHAAPACTMIPFHTSSHTKSG